MAALKNFRHEAFACALANGETADHAYEMVGFKPHRGNAARLSANESIRARVDEIVKFKTAGAVFSRADILRELAENSRLARDQGQIQASNTALINYGKELGMFVDRRLVGVRNVDDMSEEECLEILGGEPEPAEIGTAAGSPPAGHA